MDDANSDQDHVVGPAPVGPGGDQAAHGGDAVGGADDGPSSSPEAASEDRAPSVPGQAVEQPDGGVLVQLGTWLDRVRRGRRVEAMAVAMTDAGEQDQGGAVHRSWSETAEGFVVENRADGAITQTWVPAVVSPAGDVKAAAGRPPGGRRRRANVDGGRRHKHKVLVTPAEEARLQVLARRQNITIPRMLVERAFAPDTQTVSERRQLAAQLMEFDRVVSGVAVNMNQIARATNTGYDLPADFAATQAQLRSVLERITECINVLNELNYRDLGE